MIIKFISPLAIILSFTFSLCSVVSDSMRTDDTVDQLHGAMASRSESAQATLSTSRSEVKTATKSHPSLEKQVHAAILDGEAKTVHDLLKIPTINVNALDHSLGYTPLMIAAERGEKEIVRILLAEPSVDITAISTGNKLTALFFAALQGDVDILRDLVNSRSAKEVLMQVNLPTSWGATAAARNGHLDAVKFLLSLQGINVDLTDEKGNTALMHAVGAKSNSTEMVRELLQKSINLNVVNKDQQTALSLAVNLRRLDIVKMFFLDLRCISTVQNQFVFVGL